MGTEKPGFVEVTRFFGFADKSDRRNPVSWALLWGVRNRVSFRNLGLQAKIVAETRFLSPRIDCHFFTSCWAAFVTALIAPKSGAGVSLSIPNQSKYSMLPAGPAIGDQIKPRYCQPNSWAACKT